MCSSLQLLEESGLRLCYLVDGAVPHANKKYQFKLSLVADSYKPDRFRGYMQHMRSTFSSPLFMDPWVRMDIEKVAARLHPQLSSALVSWQQNVVAHTQLCHVALTLAMAWL